MPCKRVCFKMKCILYDNEYFLWTHAEQSSNSKPCKTQVRTKQEINKKQRNKQVGTTHVRTDSLPVACYPSKQRLFLTHSLFFCTLQIHTIVFCQGDNVCWLFLTHSLLLSFTPQVHLVLYLARVTTRMAGANPTRVRELIILNNCFFLSLFVLWQVRSTMLIAPGRWVGRIGSGWNIGSGQVELGPVWLLGHWVGSGHRVGSSPARSLGWVIDLGWVVGLGHWALVREMVTSTTTRVMCNCIWFTVYIVK
jgi:hypothetical protein